MKDNSAKVKGKRKNADKNDKQTNMDPAPLPTQSVSHKMSKKTTLASSARSVARSKKSGSSRTKADMTKIDKDQDTEAKSKSSVSTLKPPFTQLPTKDNMKKKDSVKSKEDHENGDC